MKNRLANESSPYLLQHAENPVDWYPWCDEAFELAEKENKPILLSIGYSACHWCHVMAHECFENAQIADLMNKLFVNIKVDREERPDIDAFYMNFVSSTTGSGGWPLTCFLFPDKTPFFGGTYFPPEDRYNRPGFPKILLAISSAYHSNKDDILSNVNDILASLNSYNQIYNYSALNIESVKTIINKLEGQFDKENGGFGSAPKFPMAMILNFLLDAYLIVKEIKALEMVELTITKMSLGGIYDHIGGGYHRYSTDDEWLVPHFEKMLYDNALISIVLAKLFRITNSDFYKTKLEETLDFVLTEMTADNGAFYSTLDADSSSGEGHYYLWTKNELKNILSTEEFNIISDYFNISDTGNFEGKNILFANQKIDDFIKIYNDPESYKKHFLSAKAKMLEARKKRERPSLDDKVLTDWNALMVSAFCEAYKSTGNQKYLISALRNIDFIFEHLVKDDTVFHSIKNGVLNKYSFLDDYANLALALIDLYEITFDDKYLFLSNKITNDTIEKFFDSEDGLFFQTTKENTETPFRTKELYDNAIPSGNSTLSIVLWKLSRIFNNQDFADKSKNILKRLNDFYTKHPGGFGRYLSAFIFELFDTSEIIILGDKEYLLTNITSLYKKIKPNSIILFYSEKLAEKNHSLFDGKKSLNDKITIYVCNNFECKEPVLSIDEINNF